MSTYLVMHLGDRWRRTRRLTIKVFAISSNLPASARGSRVLPTRSSPFRPPLLTERPLEEREDFRQAVTKAPAEAEGVGNQDQKEEVIIKNITSSIAVTPLPEPPINYALLENVHSVIKNLFSPIAVPGPLAGRLKFYENHWQKITNDPVVLKIVTGWKIPFLRYPYQEQPPQKYKSNREQEDLITAEVTAMLEKGAIAETPASQDQILSNIFLTEKKGGTFRPIINLKRVNQFIPYEKFKMESLKNVKSLL